MEKKQQRRELALLHSADFLRQNSDHRMMENSINREKPPIEEMDFFSSNNNQLHDRERKIESSTLVLDSDVNVRVHELIFLICRRVVL